MSLYDYAGTPNANLICCICRNPFIEPTTVRSCNHTFCRDCIIQSLEHSEQCPVDRSPVVEEDLTPADPIVRSLVDELLVDCVHNAAGCTFTCQRQHLVSHLSDSCPYAQVPCPEGRCDGRFLRKEAGRHTHDTGDSMVECEQCRSQVRVENLETPSSECSSLATLTCVHCLAELTRAEVAEHSPKCPAQPVPCPQASFGCPYNGPRALLQDEHLPSCPYEALKGFFAINDSRLAHMAEENLMLRSKVQTLEGAMKSMRSELAVVKNALGPWYRAPCTSTSQPSLTGPTNTAQIPSGSIMTSDALANPNTDVYSEIASYFPEGISNDQYQPIHRYTNSLNHIHDHLAASSRVGLPTTAVAHPNTRAGPSTSQTIIAPLNLSATVEGTLAGLRESLVTVSASVDSLGRRNEIALSNEVLRLNEEMMSLRANIHGLRMQVHAIMMDRNAQVTGRMEVPDVGWFPLQAPPPRPPGNPPSITKL